MLSGKRKIKVEVQGVKAIALDPKKKYIFVMDFPRDVAQETIMAVANSLTKSLERKGFTKESSDIWAMSGGVRIDVIEHTVGNMKELKKKMAKQKAEAAKDKKAEKKGKKA